MGVSLFEFFYNPLFSAESWQNPASIDEAEQNKKLPPKIIKKFWNRQQSFRGFIILKYLMLFQTQVYLPFELFIFVPLPNDHISIFDRFKRQIFIWLSSDILEYTFPFKRSILLTYFHYIFWLLKNRKIKLSNVLQKKKHPWNKFFVRAFWSL